MSHLVAASLFLVCSLAGPFHISRQTSSVVRNCISSNKVRINVGPDRSRLLVLALPTAILLEGLFLNSSYQVFTCISSNKVRINVGPDRSRLLVLALPTGWASSLRSSISCCGRSETLPCLLFRELWPNMFAFQ